MKIFFILGLVSLLSQAADKPECNVSSLTRDCRIFDLAPAEIKLPDGTAFPNPRRPKTEPQSMGVGPYGPYSSEGSSTGTTVAGGVTGSGGLGVAPDAAKMEELNKNMTDLIRVRSRLAKFLGAEKGMSEDFRMNILSDPNFIFFSGVAIDKNGKFSKNPQIMNMSVMMFWPPNGKEQKYQNVPIDQLVEFMNSSGVSKQTRKAIQEVVELQKKSAMMYGTTYSNPVNDEAQKKIQAQQEAYMQQRRAKAKDLFDVAQRSFKKVFNANTSDKNTEALIQTMDNLSFKFEDEVPEDMRQACKDGPNAYYNRSLHTFVICNSVLNYPDNQLVGIIGHEMGHSISSCNLSLGLDKVDPEMLNSLISKKSASASVRDNELLRDLKRVLPENRAVRIGNDYVISESFRRYAEDVKLYTPIVNRIEKEDYPFAKVKECIVQNSKFREVSTDDARKITEKASQFFKEKGSTFSAEDQKDLQARAERSIECIGGFGEADETGEAMSDMWGSLAIEEYLSEHPPKTDLERLSLYSYFGTSYCANHQEKAKFNASIRPQQLSLSQLSLIAKSGHRQEQARLNLVHPPDETSSLTI
ncbi:MAG: hypothetical protein JNL11_08575 [Bdellovibrionaceae bacterium]|nr:hypothetical protein [Pseudobdellovibrionaceae bacterium]